MGQEISIGDLVKKIGSLLSISTNIKTDSLRVRPENSEVERLLCNNNKILKNTNWKPDYDLDKGISETIEWIKNYMDMYKPDIYNV
jgi:dTDP-glucose 4,6-dehydratase